MKRLLLLAVTLLAVAIPLSAQTTNLPSTTVDYIVYGYPYTYVNLDANDIPITINNTPYYFNAAAHTDVNGNCVSTCYVTFQNLLTGEEIPVPYVGGFSPLPTPNKPTTLTGTFSGAFNGSFKLVLIPVTPKPPCGRYGCRTHWIQGDLANNNPSTLTLQ